eukprot:m51a1_g5459 hypothetical protein (101) ;mRNA; f:237940-238369
MERMELFLQPGDAQSEDLLRWHVPVARRLVDKDPGALDQIQSATGQRRVPALRNDRDYIFERDRIIQTLEGAPGTSAQAAEAAGKKRGFMGKLKRLMPHW